MEKWGASEAAPPLPARLPAPSPRRQPGTSAPAQPAGPPAALAGCGRQQRGGVRGASLEQLQSHDAFGDIGTTFESLNEKRQCFQGGWYQYLQTYRIHDIMNHRLTSRMGKRRQGWRTPRRAPAAAHPEDVHRERVPADRAADRPRVLRRGRRAQSLNSGARPRPTKARHLWPSWTS